MPVSRRGWVRRVVEVPTGSRIRRARIVKVNESGEQPGQPYSNRSGKRVDGNGKVTVRMKLNEDARRDLAKSDTGKIFAQLETTVVERDGTRRKNVEWAILRSRSSSS
jgi:hypothetical protein